MARNFNPESFSGYTGRLMESEVFGDVSKEKIEQGIKKLILSPREKDDYEASGYLNYGHSIELAKIVQDIDPNNTEIGPSNPLNKFANDLHATIAEEIDLEDFDKLRFYSSVGTPLDYKHGADAFFELDKDNGVFIVTIDVTMKQSESGKNQKANVLIRMPDGAPDKSDKDYDSKLKEIAKTVSDVIKSGDRNKKTEVTI